jgi:hypothetical protein
MQQTQTDLQTIRLAIEANTRLTSLSGAALVVSGLISFLAAGLTANAGYMTAASRAGLAGPELGTMVLLWGSAFVMAVTMNLMGMLYRARIDGQPLAARLGKRVLFAMLPALAVGGALTLALALQGQLQSIFGIWMLCYGAALISAGAFSLASVRMLGIFTLVAGVASVFPGLGVDFLLFTGAFGAGHFLLGVWVGVRHGW